MKILYSGAITHLAKQEIPSNSLGGYISSTLVPNSFMNNLFPDISNLSLENRNRETKMIVLQNDTGSAITDITIHFVFPADTSVRILIAAVLPALDDCGNPIFESINSSKSKPYVGTFVEADGVDDAANVGDLDNEGYLGLWITREVISDSEYLENNKTCQELYNIKYEGATPLPLEENIQMIINYT